MKVDLIIPPNYFLGDDKRNPPLGVLYVAAVARAEGHDVKVTDLRGKTGDLTRHLNLDAEVYGFTTTTPKPFTMLSCVLTL